MTNSQPAKVFFQHMDLLDKLTERRFKKKALAEEAGAYVLDRLCADDWKKLRCYQDTGSFRAYLTQVILRLLEDFARKRFGRKRPPVSIVTKGLLWTRLFYLLCAEGYSPRDASAMVAQEGLGSANERLAYDAALDIVSTITDCGEILREEELRDGWEEQEAPGRAVDAEPPEVLLEESRKAALLEAIRTFFTFSGKAPPEMDIKAFAYYQNFLQKVISLTEEESVLLRMVYEDGLTPVAAGKILQLTAAQAHGRLRRLLDRLHRQISNVSAAAEQFYV